MAKVKIQIDNKKYSAEENENVLQVAIRNKIDIPHFCWHEDLPTAAACRACLIEVDNEIKTACTIKAKKGIKIKTDSQAVIKARKKNMEMLFAGMDKKIKKPQAEKINNYIKKYRLNPELYKKPKITSKIHKMGSAAEYEPSLCINCSQCVAKCHAIGVNFLEFKDKGAATHLGHSDNKDIDCIYCGQCTVHCPVNAIREQNQIADVEKDLRNKNKIVIAQIAPSIRCSIGEEFDLEPGINLSGQIYTALRQLGFDKIFDVNMGADITTITEAHELVDRLKHKKQLPMFTSCCPGWVKFIEFYYPEMLSHLTSARSPQIHSGGAYKTWWAKKAGINPKKISVVSIMPCTSKKYEANHKKLKINGLNPVDHVITTREFAALLKKKNINLPKLKKSKVDQFGTFSGAAAIYGASGGVMESALRTAKYLLTKKDMGKIEFKTVRGFEGFREADIKIGKNKLKVAVVATAKNAHKIIKEIKAYPNKYHYIEVMACPGGCIGGGGQPIPSTANIIKQRIAGLYKIDNSMKLRRAHNNPIVMEYFNSYLAKLKPKQRTKLLHTTYSPKKKYQ